MTIFGDDVTGGAQTIAVHRAAGIAPVSEYDTGRAVPRFHMHGGILVECPQIRVHVFHVLPCRRDQETQRTKYVHAA